MKSLISPKGALLGAHQGDNLRMALGLTPEEFDQLESLTKLRSLQDNIGRVVWVDAVQKRGRLQAAVSMDQIRVQLHLGRQRQPWTGTVDDVRLLNDPREGDIVMVPRVQHHISNVCRTGKVMVRVGPNVRVEISYGRQRGRWSGPASEVEIVRTGVDR